MLLLYSCVQLSINALRKPGANIFRLPMHVCRCTCTCEPTNNRKHCDDTVNRDRCVGVSEIAIFARSACVYTPPRRQAAQNERIVSVDRVFAVFPVVSLPQVHVHLPCRRVGDDREVDGPSDRPRLDRGVLVGGRARGAVRALQSAAHVPAAASSAGVRTSGAPTRWSRRAWCARSTRPSTLASATSKPATGEAPAGADRHRPRERQLRLGAPSPRAVITPSPPPPIRSGVRKFINSAALVWVPTVTHSNSTPTRSS